MKYEQENPQVNELCEFQIMKDFRKSQCCNCRSKFHVYEQCDQKMRKCSGCKGARNHHILDCDGIPKEVTREELPVTCPNCMSKIHTWNRCPKDWKICPKCREKQDHFPRDCRETKRISSPRRYRHGRSLSPSGREKRSRVYGSRVYQSAAESEHSLRSPRRRKRERFSRSSRSGRGSGSDTSVSEFFTEVQPPLDEKLERFKKLKEQTKLEERQRERENRRSNSRSVSQNSYPLSNSRNSPHPSRSRECGFCGGPHLQFVCPKMDEREQKKRDLKIKQQISIK